MHISSNITFLIFISMFELVFCTLEGMVTMKEEDD